MSGIADSMRKKGYLPIAASEHGAIGIRKDRETAMNRLPRVKWFYNGTNMSDGAPITIAAYNDVQEAEYLKRGFMPVETCRSQPGKVKKGGGAGHAGKKGG